MTFLFEFKIMKVNGWLIFPFSFLSLFFILNFSALPKFSAPAWSQGKEEAKASFFALILKRALSREIWGIFLRSRLEECQIA
jgi:hypothetical protein